jgi:hypothetical protein
MVGPALLLNESIQRLNLKLYRSKPYGNCFFTSISKHFKLINKPNGSGKDIRKNVIKYIKNNKNIFDYIKTIAGMSSQEVDDDLYELRQDGVYDLDIFDILPVIIATQYNIKICIYTWMEVSNQPITEKDIEIYYPIQIAREKLGELCLLYSNLEHYDLLFPLNNKIES